MEIVSLFEVDVRRDDDDPPGYDTGYARLAPKLGASRLGGTVYELPPGQSICPYHYEYGNEEWLIVLTGRPMLRTPEGERELSPGQVACFQDGPAGAHKVTNSGKDTSRVLMLSTKTSPDAAVYPDSGKMGIWTATRPSRSGSSGSSPPSTTGTVRPKPAGSRPDSGRAPGRE